MKKLYSYTLLLGMAVMPGIANADLFLGLDVGASIWQGEFDGQIGEDPQSFDDLGIGKDNYSSFYFQLELLGLPEIRLRQTNISTSGNGTITTDFTLGDISYPAATNVATTIDTQATDLTIYWQILDNYLSADIGISASYLDGYAEADDGVNSDKVEFTTIIPMGFLRARVDLPFSGWYVGAETQFIGSGGDSYSDSSAMIGWQIESLADFGINLGYRSISAEFEDLDGFDADFDLSGPFASATFHF